MFWSFIRGLLKRVIIQSGRNGRLARLALPTESALYRTTRRLPDIHSVLDVGGSDGRWSLMAMKYLPKAQFLILDAQEKHLPKLKRLRTKKENVDFEIVAIGDRAGTIYFDKSDPFGGQASSKRENERFDLARMETLDNLVSSKGYSGPFLIKLDTHGFEVPIFEGAAKTLRETVLLVVECYIFQIAESSLRFHQMCTYLEQKGFRCIDISEPLFRPKDLALWQFDLFFVPDNRPEFADNHYM